MMNLRYERGVLPPVLNFVSIDGPAFIPGGIIYIRYTAEERSRRAVAGLLAGLIQWSRQEFEAAI